jgi:thioesterase domain-containing protein
MDVSTGVIGLDLDIELVDGPEGLRGWVDYATELFDAPTIRRMVEHFRLLLDAIASNPDQRLSALPARDGDDRYHAAVPALAHPNRAGRPAFRPPRDALERQLALIWEDLLDIRPIGTRDNFFDLGGYSLLALRMLARIEKGIGTKLPVATFFWTSTIEEMAGTLRQTAWRPPWSSLVPIHAGGSQPPFFCVHGFGGGVLGYVDLAREVGPDQPFYGLQALGRDGWDEPHTSIESMAAHYLAEIRAVQPEGPYHLGGYCAGATIAFEMAQQLQAEGHEVALLAVIEGEAPGSPYRRLEWRPGWVLRFLGNLPYWLRDFLLLTQRQRLGRSRRKVRSAARRFGGLIVRSTRAADAVPLGDLVDDPADVPEDIVSLIAIHQDAFASYQPRAYEGRVTLIRTRRHPLLSSFDPEKGWGSLAPGRVDLRMIPGAHHTILRQPHVRVLAARLRECLAVVRRSKLPAGGSRQQ